jgi:acetyl esterase/lipase
MESISSRIVKLLLRILKYKQLFETEKLDLKKIRKDDIAIPEKWICRGCLISKEEIDSQITWVLTPKKIRNKKALIYFHGGGYIQGMVKQQWSTIAKIAVKKGSKVFIPDFPFAPEHNYKDVFMMISASYKKILKSTNASDITFIGDSAGGGLMFSFAMKLRDEGKDLPSKLIGLSPWVDVTMTNPEMPSIEKYDPMISAPGLKIAGEMYAAGDDTTNYLLSPLYGEFNDLPPIHIFAGTHDILQPDEKIFAEKAKDVGVETFYYEYPRMIHGWIFLPMPETSKAIRQIIEII